MNLRRREVLFFLAFAGIAFAWLLIPEAEDDQGRADRYTGRRGPTPAALLDVARGTGRAEAALRVLIDRRHELNEPDALDEATAVLHAELADDGEPSPAAHPGRDAIEDELAGRESARAVLATAADEPSPARSVAGLLRRLEADAAVAQATEAFFAPLAGTKPPPPGAELPSAPDGAAVVVAARANPTADVLLGVAETFRKAGRRRGWNRWLRRAFEAYPSNPACAVRLAGVYIADQRLPEALLVLRATNVPETPDILNLRAQVAGWLGKPAVEADAIERLLDTRGDPAMRKRLIELLRFLGQSARAVPHAKSLAETRGDDADWKRALEVALEAGLLDEAIAIAEAATASPAVSAKAKRLWRERIARAALNDLRLDRAIQELELLVREHPEGRFADQPDLTYVQQLEWLYRSRSRDVALLDLLLARLAREPPAEARRALEDDVIYIAQRLGRTDDVRSIFAARMAAVRSAKMFLGDFWDYETARVPGLVEKGLALLFARDTDTSTAATLFTLLDERMDPARRRQTLERLLERHPKNALLKSRYAQLLDKLDPVASATRFEALSADNPDDLELLRAWVLRASWLDDVERQRRAREALRARVPDDRENRRRLADLYEALDRPRDALEQWLYLAGTTSAGDVETERRLIGSLLANARYAEALPLVRVRVERPEATDADMDLLLDVLQANEHYEEALPLARTRAERPEAEPHDRARYLDLLQATERYEEALPLARARAERPEAEPRDRARYLDLLQATERYEEAVPLARARAETRDATEADRERLLDLLVAAGANEEALPELRARASRSRKDEDRLVAILQTLERQDELFAVLERRATAEGASFDDRRAYGDTLLGAAQYRAAQRVYVRLLEDQPSDRHVLLRLAQSHSWNNDPRGAIRYARRRLALPESDTPSDRAERATTSFTLGEALWAGEQKQEAHRHFRAAVETFKALPKPGDDHVVMLAKSLVRLGAVDEANRILAKLVTRRPDAPNLGLDYVDAMFAGKRYNVARRQLERVRGIAPEDPRLKRLDGALFVAVKCYERAIRPLEGVVRLRPDDASAHADLGWAYRESGCWRPALSAWCRSWSLGNRDVQLARTIQDLRFDLGPTASAFGTYRFAGDDRVSQAGVGARVPFANERFSFAFRSEWAEYSGPAEATGGRVTDAIGVVDASARYRFGRRHHVDVGLSGYLDRAAGPDLGPWAAVRFEGKEPYRFLKIEGFVDRIWSEPAAAVGLGGARSGVTAEGWHDLGPNWWAAGMLSYQRLALESGATGAESDGFATWRAEIGRRLLTGCTVVSARVSYSGSRLLDDRDLAQSVPVGERFDFVTGALYAERHFGMRWYATFEAFAGTDLANPGFIWGAEGTLRFLVSACVRLRLAAGFGTQARFQDGDSGHVDLALDWIF